MFSIYIFLYFDREKKLTKMFSIKSRRWFRRSFFNFILHVHTQALLFNKLFSSASRLLIFWVKCIGMGNRHHMAGNSKETMALYKFSIRFSRSIEIITKSLTFFSIYFHLLSRIATMNIYFIYHRPITLTDEKHISSLSFNLQQNGARGW